MKAYDLTMTDSALQQADDLHQTGAMLCIPSSMPTIKESRDLVDLLVMIFVTIVQRPMTRAELGESGSSQELGRTPQPSNHKRQIRSGLLVGNCCVRLQAWGTATSGGTWGGTTCRSCVDVSRDGAR